MILEKVKNKIKVKCGKTFNNQFKACSMSAYLIIKETSINKLQ